MMNITIILPAVQIRREADSPQPTTPFPPVSITPSPTPYNSRTPFSPSEYKTLLEQYQLDESGGITKSQSDLAARQAAYDYENEVFETPTPTPKVKESRLPRPLLRQKSVQSSISMDNEEISENSRTQTATESPSSADTVRTAIHIGSGNESSSFSEARESTSTNKDAGDSTSANERKSSPNEAFEETENETESESKFTQLSQEITAKEHSRNENENVIRKPDENISEPSERKESPILKSLEKSTEGPRETVQIALGKIQNFNTEDGDSVFLTQIKDNPDEQSDEAISLETNTTTEVNQNQDSTSRKNSVDHDLEKAKEQNSCEIPATDTKLPEGTKVQTFECHEAKSPELVELKAFEVNDSKPSETNESKSSASELAESQLSEENIAKTAEVTESRSLEITESKTTTESKSSDSEVMESQSSDVKDLKQIVVTKSSEARESIASEVSETIHTDVSESSPVLARNQNNNEDLIEDTHNQRISNLNNSPTQHITETTHDSKSTEEIDESQILQETSRLYGINPKMSERADVPTNQELIPVTALGSKKNDKESTIASITKVPDISKSKTQTSEVEEAVKGKQKKGKDFRDPRKPAVYPQRMTKTTIARQALAREKRRVYVEERIQSYMRNSQQMSSPQTNKLVHSPTRNDNEGHYETSTLDKAEEKVHVRNMDLPPPRDPRQSLPDINAYNYNFNPNPNMYSSYVDPYPKTLSAISVTKPPPYSYSSPFAMAEANAHRSHSEGTTQETYASGSQSSGIYVDSNTEATSNYWKNISEQGFFYSFRVRQSGTVQMIDKGIQTGEQPQSYILDFSRKSDGSYYQKSSKPLPQTSSTTHLPPINRDKILRDISETVQLRHDAELRRGELIQRANDLQALVKEKREKINRRHEFWHKKYIEESSMTRPMEAACNSLRSELNTVHRRLIAHLEGRDLPLRLRDGPSKKANYKIMAARLQHEIKELQQKAKSAKLRLESEIKLKEQAEREVRDIRNDLAHKKVVMSLARSQIGGTLPAAAHPRSYDPLVY